MIGYGVAATCFAGLGDHARRPARVGRPEADPRDAAAAAPAYLLAVLASTFVVFLIEAALIIAIGRLLFSVAGPRPSSSRCSPSCCSAPRRFAAMGLGITALVRSAEGSSAVINAVYLPMAIISGTFFSTEVATRAFLRVIAAILPLTHYTELTRDVMVRNQHVWSDSAAISVVLAWGVVGLVGAVRGFRWQPRESL